MNFMRNLIVLVPLLAAGATPCFGMMSIEEVSKTRAKELRLKIQSKPAGPEAVWVQLDLEPKGDLKDFSRVDLEMQAEGKLLLSSALKETPSKDGHVQVSFTVARSQIDAVTLRIVTGQPMDYTGHDVRLKEFIEPKNAAASAVTAEEEARFIASVRKAVEARDSAGLMKLTRWEGSPEEVKQTVQSGYAGLVAEKAVVFDFKLAPPDPKWVGQDRAEKGVAYRANLPVIRQLEVKGSDPADKKTLLVICFPVGEVKGKLFLLASAPVK